MNPLQNINQIRNPNNNIINNPLNTENNQNLRTNRNLFLSRIIESIIIDAHPHPLNCCFTPERAKFSQIWTCKNCGNNYSFKIPSFYCTYCDYDFCQNCLMKLPLGRITMMNKPRYYNVYINTNHPNYKKNLHQHHLALVKFEEYNYNEKNHIIHCKSFIPQKDINLLKDEFYFCSLCYTYVCKECFKNGWHETKNQNTQNNNNPIFIAQFSNNSIPNNINVNPGIPTNNTDSNNNQNLYNNNQNFYNNNQNFNYNNQNFNNNNQNFINNYQTLNNNYQTLNNNYQNIKANEQNLNNNDKNINTNSQNLNNNNQNLNNNNQKVDNNNQKEREINQGENQNQTNNNNNSDMKIAENYLGP